MASKTANRRTSSLQVDDDILKWITVHHPSNVGADDVYETGRRGKCGRRKEGEEPLTRESS